jgi:hypothetical protein
MKKNLILESYEQISDDIWYERFDEYLDQGGEPVEILGSTYDLHFILRKCDPKILSACGIECETSTIKSMKELISSTLFYCDDEIVEILTGFADSFGKAYSKEQIASCEYCRSELLKKREKLLEKDSKNKKIQLALCLSISFSLIILLI